jgi:hypothetical protein
MISTIEEDSVEVNNPGDPTYLNFNNDAFDKMN